MRRLSTSKMRVVIKNAVLRPLCGCANIFTSSSQQLRRKRDRFPATPDERPDIAILCDCSTFEAFIDHWTEHIMTA
jgi:hypothetical protein